jgi:glycerol-3-phosphate acyltransferase PlsY
LELSALLITAITCYLIGSISFSRLLTHFLKPGTELQDIELHVDGIEQSYKITSIGGNTVSMKLGPRVGCLASILDALKVFLPTLILFLLFPRQFYFLVAALAGFIGHCWPIYYRFKGGRGVSAFYGGLFAFDPIGALVVSLIGILLGITLFRKVKMLNILAMYTGGVLLVIPWMWLTKNSPLYLIYALLINILFIMAMLPDIKQIIQILREHGWRNVDVGMDQFPMGQSMSKMTARINQIFRKQTKGE